MLLSIVIPCYNVMDYIGRTIESIKNQDIDFDFEIIIVNDGSTDKTEEIAREALKGIKRYKIVNKDNGGVSSARNLGLSHVVGDFVFFLDGDDVLMPNFFSEISVIKDAKSDVVLWSYIEEKTSKKHRKHLVKGSKNKNYLEDFLYGISKIWMGSVLFKTQFIIENKLRFDEQTHYGEDREFIAKSLYYATTIHTIPHILSVYKWREGSAVRIKQLYTRKKFSSIEAYKRLCYLMKDHDGNGYYQATVLNMCITLISHKIYLLDQKDNLYRRVIDECLYEYLSICKPRRLSKFSVVVCIAKLLWRCHMLNIMCYSIYYGKRLLTK